ncbi:MAG: MFS transporter [Planctomycetes bacterium]|nr:MFS transporter [Planctomycetota bacterium]
MRNLGLLWVGQFVSQAGDGFFQVTLPFLVLLLAGEDAGTKTGVVMLANFLPFLVIGPFFGALADRMPQRRLMIASDLARGLVVLAVPAAFVLGRLSWPLVGAVSFFLATAATLFNPARDALLPRLAQGRVLLRVNALFQTSSQLALLAGALGVGFLLGFDETAAREAIESGDPGREIARIVRLYWVNAATYGVSLATLAFLALPRGAGVPTPPATRPWRDVHEGLAHAGRSGLLRGLLFITAADNFFIMGPAIIGANLLVKDTFGLGPGHVGLLEGALVAGWLLGTLVLYSFGRAWAKGRMLIAGMVLDGATYVPFFWIDDYALLLPTIAFHGFWIPFIQVPRTTLVQERVPREMLGRIFSLINLTFVGFTALSLLATGWAGDALAGPLGKSGAPPVLFLAGGLGGALCGLLGLAFRDLRGAR